MEDGTRVYVIRYSEKPYANCIYEHQKIENEVGYCWFAKWGKKVLDATWKEVMNDNAYILLYYKDKSYLAKLIGFSHDRPSIGYPEYYNQIVFENNSKISVYLKLNNFKKVESTIIEKLITNSTGRVVEEIFHHSSCANVYATYYEDISEELHDEDACIYVRKNRCGNKKCVNYEYLCEKPKQCKKYVPRYYKM